jgi:hypothetical protein
VDTSKLAPETLRLWEFLSTQPALADFILIGGTALTMHIGHRISASATRSISRDWLDLYILFRQHGFSLADFHDASQGAAIHDPAQTIARAFQNLCRGVSSLTDPGYETLMETAPPLSKLAEFFKAMRDEYEIQQARETFRGRQGDL